MLTILGFVLAPPSQWLSVRLSSNQARVDRWTGRRNIKENRSWQLCEIGIFPDIFTRSTWSKIFPKYVFRATFCWYKNRFVYYERKEDARVVRYLSSSLRILLTETQGALHCHPCPRRLQRAGPKWWTWLWNHRPTRLLNPLILASNYAMDRLHYASGIGLEILVYPDGITMVG